MATPFTVTVSPAVRMRLTGPAPVPVVQNEARAVTPASFTSTVKVQEIWLVG